MSWVALVTALIVIGIFISIYNRLVQLRNRLKNAFSQIDVQLKRRYDLIPNLIETAKAYMNHERQTLEAVVKARNAALAAESEVSSNPSAAGGMQKLAAAEQ